MTALSRRAQWERILGRCFWGTPEAVRAYYALGAQPLFVEAKEGLVDFWGSNESYTELLWYLEVCERAGWKLSLGRAVSWMLHREDGFCGLCSGVPYARLNLRDRWSGICERLCFHCHEVHQKLRDGKVCA